MFTEPFHSQHEMETNYSCSSLRDFWNQLHTFLLSGMDGKAHTHKHTLTHPYWPVALKVCAVNLKKKQKDSELNFILSGANLKLQLVR